MRIAQIAPLYESVPPRFYGGTERVVSHITEELVREGHEVTLFASGDSITTARLLPGCPRSLRLEGKNVIDPLAYHIGMIDAVARQADEFDILHFHIDYLHFPVTRGRHLRAVTTLHGRLDIADVHPLFREFTDMNLVSISNAQRRPMPWAGWAGTVYHGLPEDLFQPQLAHQGTYLAFIGRISPEKRVDRAIEIARRAGMPIRIAAKIDAVDKEYFESEIRKLFDDPLVEFIGEIGESEKAEFFGNACALLFPIDWPEPFGLALIESMACGTPVVAFGLGSVPEVVDQGVTGFVVDSVDDAVDAVLRVCELDRSACRRVFEERFTAARMCSDYLKIYRRICNPQLVPLPSSQLLPSTSVLTGDTRLCQ